MHITTSLLFIIHILLQTLLLFNFIAVDGTCTLSSHFMLNNLTLCEVQVLLLRKKPWSWSWSRRKMKALVLILRKSCLRPCSNDIKMVVKNQDSLVSNLSYMTVLNGNWLSINSSWMSAQSATLNITQHVLSLACSLSFVPEILTTNLFHVSRTMEMSRVPHSTFVGWRHLYTHQWYSVIR